MIKMAKILHPTDFSEPSRYALGYAVSFAREFGAQLWVLHVIEEVARAMYFDMLQAPPVAAIMADIEAQAKKLLDGLLDDDVKKELNAQCLIRKGVPFLEVVRCAEEIGADIIVCGTHGHTGIKHVLFGSVAEKIIRKSPCPVLSVRHPEHQSETPPPKQP